MSLRRDLTAERGDRGRSEAEEEGAAVHVRILGESGLSMPRSSSRRCRSSSVRTRISALISSSFFQALIAESGALHV